MKRTLQGTLIAITVIIGVFCAFGLIFAGNNDEQRVLRAETGMADSPQPVQPPESPEPGLEENKPEENLIEEAGRLDSILLLVNRQNSIPDTYIPQDLVTADVRFSPNVLAEKKKLRKEAAEALARLMQGAEQDNVVLYCVSGYRSYATQKAIYEAKLKAAGLEHTRKYVAYPGESEHQTGLAMDLTNASGVNKSLTESFGDTEEGKWLQAKAHLYGFIIRYQKGKESITGYNYEPWHIRYVGIPAAGSIYEQGLTLEEYLQKKPSP